MDKKGFTLVELLVTLCVTGILMTSFYNCFLSQHRTYVAQEKVVEMNQVARASIDIMMREIRHAGYKEIWTDLNGIPLATADTIRILADFNEDGDTLDAKEDITYAYDAQNLQITRTTPEETVVFCDDVTSLAFSYTMADGSVTSSPSDTMNIRKVTINLGVRARKPVGNNNYSTVNLVLDVVPRNMEL